MASYKDNYGKYYCKYCDLTLARNAASIAQHEQGNRHKRNVARFLRTVGRGSAEDREAARELRRIEAATGLHFSTPKARPPPSASLNPTPPPPPSSVTLVPPAEPAPVSTYDDNEDEESLVRRGVAAPMPGEWTVVEPVQPPSPGTEEGNHEDERKQWNQHRSAHHPKWRGCVWGWGCGSRGGHGGRTAARGCIVILGRRQRQ